MRIPRSLAILAFIVCLTRPALAADVAAPADRAAIEQVVQQFQSAIIAKDGKALGALFLADHNSWLSVADNSTFAAVKARNPAARKVMPDTWQQFADFVATSKKTVEERFSNVRIESNGAIASVYFDFEFMIDGAVTNRGSESWQMVRAEDGWKISSMLFSIGR
jgi:hypothetical protein